MVYCYDTPYFLSYKNENCGSEIHPKLIHVAPETINSEHQRTLKSAEVHLKLIHGAPETINSEHQHTLKSAETWRPGTWYTATTRHIFLSYKNGNCDSGIHPTLMHGAQETINSEHQHTLKSAETWRPGT